MGLLLVAGVRGGIQERDEDYFFSFSFCLNAVLGYDIEDN